ncbi:aspartate aminotransferase family protein [Exilibacterium tricleocarpae]|uniref:Aspartate aminotransferase family protein n=1 Tax=Exilibacterium tricleocarpae TaxID=2591008 RepID=A0A545T8F9_9GAMM|nr:aspartate aminotransferase family protein [Exilibacterium tricleocarpae]TQV73512.1 aspartate aminotransferase family protein [Exilibacterium tricleocarpae]
MPSANRDQGTYDTADYQAADGRHHLHPFTDFKSLRSRGTRVITRAQGIYLWDSEGHKMLDAMAGLWCVNLGYGREELAQAAYTQMQALPYYNSFFQTTTQPAIKLAEKLAEVSPESLNHAFFTGSGSESNDTIIRMVRRYWQLLEQPQKTVIISRNNAYHGSTVAATSLGGMRYMHDQNSLAIEDFVHIDQPYWFGEGGGRPVEAFGLAVAQQLESKILELGVNRVAAFIAEPVQGAGGVIIPPASYWPEIQRICDHYGILLIADEVICGFGRLGAWFGSDHFGIRPDLMTIAKGLSSGYLPIGGVLVGDRVAGVLIDQGGEFAHGFTYSGHPTTAAVALKNLEILQREQIIETVAAQTAPYLEAAWGKLGEHPLVGEARSLGLLGAIELVKDKQSRIRFDDKGSAGALCRDICFDNGLVMRAVGDTMVISPPLVITTAEIDELVEKASRCLDKTLAAINDGKLSD